MIAAFDPHARQSMPQQRPGASGRWVEVLSHLHPRYGGLSSAVPALSSAVTADGRYRAQIAAFCAEGEQYVPDGMEVGNLTFWPARRLSWLRSRKLRDQFQATLQGASGVHIHGLWEQSSVVAASAIRTLRKPYVLSAHGMLEPWALRNKRWKKSLYSALVERSVVQGAACLHALTRAEAVQYRDYGAKGPIAIIPNGVDVPGGVTATEFLQRVPELAGKRLVLFLGRLHPKKGVDLLVHAWREIAGSWPEAHLLLAGPDSEGTEAQLRTLSRQHGLEGSVSFTGMLAGSLKWSALAAATCFVLPSHSEGLSMGVLEAMGMGLPVIVTAQCNMPEVEQISAGWQVQPDAGELAAALGTFLCNTDRANRAIGARGQALVAQNYSWESVGKRMADLYGWLQGAPRPESFEVMLP